MGDLTVSADSHVVEPRDVFVGLETRFGDAAPRIAITAEEGEGMVFPCSPEGSLGAGRLGIAGRRLDSEREGRRRPGHKPFPEDPTDPKTLELIREGYEGIRKGIIDPVSRKSDQNLDGVGAEVLYPSFLFRVFGLENEALVAACFRNYNDWLNDFCTKAPDRLVGLALIPLHNPKIGASELERVLKIGFRGGCIPCTAPHERPYRSSAYDPVWALAEEASFPLSMHIGTGASTGKWDQLASDPVIHDPIHDYASAFVAVQSTLSELICQGVAHRFPRLRFVCAEFNIGWIANWLERLDQGYDRMRKAAYAKLDLRPSEYWHRQFFATFEDDRAGVLTCELVGTDNLMWGNDYPHRDSTWPESRSLLDELFVGIPDDVRHKMTVSNATRLYGIPKF